MPALIKPRQERGDEETTTTNSSDEPEIPELVDPGWLYHASALSGTSFWAVARRLPATVREAIGLAWGASRRDTIAAISLNLVAGTMTTFGLLATGNVLTELFSNAPTPDRVRAATPALIAAAVAVMLRGGLGIAAGWAQARLAPQINDAVETRLFAATTAVELAAFDDAGFAEEMARARERGVTEAASIVDSSVNLLTGLVGLAATAVAVMFIQPLLLPCLILASTPQAITAIRMARREYLAMLRWITRRRRMWMLGYLMADRNKAQDVRAFQMREFLLREYVRVMRAETEEHLVLVRSQAGSRLAGATMAGLATGGLYVLLGVLLLDGAVPLAAAATAVIALQTASTALGTTIRATNDLYEEALYYGDFRAFLDRAAGHTPAKRSLIAPPFEEIAVENVSLAYPGSTTKAVDDVSLVLRRGEVIALVGENGSGKTSLAKLIAGLYRPTEGMILWNGISTYEFDADTLATQVAVVSQDQSRMPFTAGLNIRVGRTQPRASGPTMHEAAGAAAAHDMIMDLPSQYDTLLNREFKDGQDLSGGQWQRLLAARGFYRDASVLLCDEPSSALDPRAEHALFQQLGRRSDRAVVLITHRLANVRHADRIYVMHQGRLVEEGTHDELTARGGRYAELFALQASGYLEASQLPT